MKALCIDDFTYCMLPEGVHDVDSLLEYFNKNYNSFVKLNVWDDSKTVAPYFIEDSLKEEIRNVSSINNANIVDIHTHSEKEYLERLLEAMKKKCIDCEHFEGEMIIDDGTRKKLSLDGECFLYTKKED